MAHVFKDSRVTYNLFIPIYVLIYLFIYSYIRSPRSKDVKLLTRKLEQRYVSGF